MCGLGGCKPLQQQTSAYKQVPESVEHTHHSDAQLSKQQLKQRPSRPTSSGQTDTAESHNHFLSKQGCDMTGEPRLIAGLTSCCSIWSSFWLKYLLLPMLAGPSGRRQGNSNARATGGRPSPRNTHLRHSGAEGSTYTEADTLLLACNKQHASGRHRADAGL